MANWLNRLRLDLIEVCSIVFFASLGVGLYAWSAAVTSTRTALESAWLEKAGAQTAPEPPRYTDQKTSEELDRLRVAYGPTHYSEGQEEWIIRDFFKDRRGGFFVDVGASHYRNNSNTFYLDTRLGWSGIAVDPQAMFESGYRKYRPRTRFFPLFVSDASNGTAELYIAEGASLSASGNRDFIRPFGKKVLKDTVPTITLTDLLTRLQVGRIDLLSVDVELSEPKVLAGFDITRFKPTLVCIEAHPDVRQQILDYFARHAYVAVGKYLRVDVQNLYFTPLNDPALAQHRLPRSEPVGLGGPPCAPFASRLSSAD
jgi:FkbM family methyltransferase